MVDRDPGSSQGDCATIGHGAPGRDGRAPWEVTWGTRGMWERIATVQGRLAMAVARPMRVVVTLALGAVVGAGLHALPALDTHPFGVLLAYVVVVTLACPWPEGLVAIAASSAIVLLLLPTFDAGHVELGIWDTASLIVVALTAGLRASEREREREAAWWRALTERSHTIKAVVGLDGRFAFVAPSSAAVLGWSAEEMRAMRPGSLAHPDDAATVQEAYALARVRGRATPPPLRFRHKDGTYRWMRLVIGDHTTDPRVGGLILNAYDVTDQVEATRAAEEALRMRDEFLASASHDLRTPLTTIQGHAGLLARRLRDTPDASPDTARGIEAMLAAARRMSGIIEDVTDATQLQAGVVLPLQIARVDLAALVRVVVAEASAGRPWLRGPVACNTPDDPVWADIDGRRIARVLQNLIDNALKYGRPERRPIEVSLSRDGWAVVAVRDWGIGIGAAGLSRVFERYYRDPGGVAHAGHRGGTGIGLASCKAVVEQHGGAITIESREGEGTTVRVYLRLADDGDGAGDGDGGPSPGITRLPTPQERRERPA